MPSAPLSFFLCSKSLFLNWLEHRTPLMCVYLHISMIMDPNLKTALAKGFYTSLFNNAVMFLLKYQSHPEKHSSSCWVPVVKNNPKRSFGKLLLLITLNYSISCWKQQTTINFVPISYYLHPRIYRQDTSTKENVIEKATKVFNYQVFKIIS